MKNYIEHIKNTREPHERRQHALQVAGALTLGLFVLWVGTLSLRLAQSSEPQSPQSSLTASAAEAAQQTDPHLEVSTTSVYGN